MSTFKESIIIPLEVFERITQKQSDGSKKRKTTKGDSKQPVVSKALKKKYPILFDDTIPSGAKMSMYFGKQNYERDIAEKQKDSGDNILFLQLFSAEHRPKVQKLVVEMNRRSDVLSWNKSSYEAIINGTVYIGTNIVEILEYLMGEKGPFKTQYSDDHKIPRETKLVFDAMHSFYNTEMMKSFCHRNWDGLQTAFVQLEETLTKNRDSERHTIFSQKAAEFQRKLDQSLRKSAIEGEELREKNANIADTQRKASLQRKRIKDKRRGMTEGEILLTRKPVEAELLVRRKLEAEFEKLNSSYKEPEDDDEGSDDPITFKVYTSEGEDNEPEGEDAKELKESEQKGTGRKKKKKKKIIIHWNRLK